MKIKGILILGVVSTLALFTCLGAQTIDFEDLSGNKGLVPAGYQGFIWSPSSYYTTDIFKNWFETGYYYGISGTYGLTIDSPGHTISIGRSDAFSLVSADVTAVLNNNQSVTITGYREGSVVWTEDLLSSFERPQTVMFPSDLIDSVVFATSGGTSGVPFLGNAANIAIDNVRMSVPEPGTIPLLTIAIGGAIFMREWRRRGRT